MKVAELKNCDRAAIFLPPWIGGPKLISLWELMKPFNGDHLFSVANQIGYISGLFEGGLMIAAATGNSVVMNQPITEKWHEGLLAYIEQVSSALCKFFDLPASIAKCEEIIKELKSDQRLKWSEAQSHVSELGKRVEAEMKAHSFFYLSRETAALFRLPLNGWSDVIIAFPSASYDIEEASKCIALQRNTAAAFHLMRVFGAGVTALGKILNEPTLDSSRNLTWDNILSRCTKELGEKFSGKSPEWQNDKQFYAAATTTLLGVKDAWRNPNAHEVGQKYTDEEALDIYNSTRAFMRQLSKKLKESP